MKYKLRYLPLFENDLYNAASYICHKLDNPDAAQRLVDEVEKPYLKGLICRCHLSCTVHPRKVLTPITESM